METNMLEVRLKDQLRLLKLVFTWSFIFENVDGLKNRTVVTVLIGPDNFRSWSVLVRSGLGLFAVLQLDLQTLRKPNFKICKDSYLVKYFSFFFLTKAVINMIFVDLGFSKKDLYLLFLKEISHVTQTNKGILGFDLAIRFYWPCVFLQRCLA